jgi:glycosyltransferase involved in cell wall biosynthesis
MHVMRNIDRDQFEIHFFVNGKVEGAYDHEITRLGGHIHYGGEPHKPLRYARRFAQITRDHGPFAVLHSHVYWYNGFVNWLGYKANIPIRIAHSHTATGAPLWKLHRKGYQILMRSLIMRYATHRVGASRQAAEALFGHHRQRSFTVLYYGMDFERFLHRRGTEEGKQLLDIPPQRKVIGHVGRFVPVKNHAFLVDVFARVISRGTDAHLLLVGDGPLVGAIEADLKSRGLWNRCRPYGRDFRW